MTADAALLALITGAVLPFLTTFITKAAWSNAIKFGVVIVAAVVIGTVELYLKGDLAGITVETAYSYLGSIYVASGLVFWLLIDRTNLKTCLLYTSDAADDLTRVDLVGR